MSSRKKIATIKDILHRLEESINEGFDDYSFETNAKLPATENETSKTISIQHEQKLITGTLIMMGKVLSFGRKITLNNLL